MLLWKFFAERIWEVELHSAFSFGQGHFSECLSAASAIVFQCKLSPFPSASFLIWDFFLSYCFHKADNLSCNTLKETAMNVITEAHRCSFNFRPKRVNWTHSAWFLVEAYWSVHGQEKKVVWMTQAMLRNSLIRNLWVTSLNLLNVANAHN